MRGFNLFAAFLGVVMLAIAVGFTVFTGTQESQALREISTQVQTVSAESIADLIRQDAHNTVVETIRRSFQDFFATNPVEPPEEAWESEGRFKEWFAKEFIAESKLTEHIADALAGELLIYQGLPLKGHTVRVVVNRSALAEALKEGSSISVRDDGTFVFIYDSSKLSPEALAGLPTIVIDGRTTVTVFPPGRWMIPVPLRVVEAYRRAKAFREKVRGHMYLFKLLFGVCSRESIKCALWKWTGSGVSPVYPSSVDSERFTVAASEVGAGEPWRAYNLMDVCTDMRLYTDDSELNKALGVEEIHCGIPKPALIAILDERLSSLLDEENASVAIVPESVRTYKTWRVAEMQAISVSQFIQSNIPIPFLKDLIERAVEALGGTAAMPITPCRPAGYLYCAAPTSLTYDYVWTDTDLRYSVTGEPAVFAFRMSFSRDFDAITTWLEARERRVERASMNVQTVDVGYDPQECEENMLMWCAKTLFDNFQSCVTLRLGSWSVIGDLAQAGHCIQHPDDPICKMDPTSLALILGISNATASDLKSKWNSVRGVGHYLYTEFNAYAEAHPDDETAQTCAQMFYAFKDENALCMDPNQNFCEHLKWLQSGTPKCDTSDADTVAYAVFWFHPFEEFAGTCRAKAMPSGP